MEGIGRKIKIGLLTIAVFKYQGKIFAFQNACPHQNTDLADGFIHGATLYCRHHHWAFDLETGAYAFDSSRRLMVFPVHVENQNVFLEINQNR